MSARSSVLLVAQQRAALVACQRVPRHGPSGTFPPHISALWLWMMLNQAWIAISLVRAQPRREQWGGPRSPLCASIDPPFARGGTSDHGASNDVRDMAGRCCAACLAWLTSW